LTYDGTHLIMSDATDTLYFRDPETFQTKRTLVVRDIAGKRVTWINELEVCILFF
jgi:glutamine cyclotransferase